MTNNLPKISITFPKNESTKVLEIKDWELKRWNLIYGYNGSGKTAISNFFRSIEEDTNLQNNYNI